MRKSKEDRACCSCLRNFDFYKDLPKGLAEPTYLGAILSTKFLILLGVLIFYQVNEFMSYQKKSELLIDSDYEE